MQKETHQLVNKKTHIVNFCSLREETAANQMEGQVKAVWRIEQHKGYHTWAQRQ